MARTILERTADIEVLLRELTNDKSCSVDERFDALDSINDVVNELTHQLQRELNRTKRTA